MKSVLISIRPKWCELIASGKKTVEVRKTRPKLDLPFKCYIYCTVDKRLLRKFDKGERIDDEHFFNEHVFVRQNTWIRGHFNPNKKIIGEFVCDRIITAPQGKYCRIPTAASQVDALDLMDYAEGKTVYGWHISNLVIYDKPRELSEFRHECNGICLDTKKKIKCKYLHKWLDKEGFACNRLKPIERAPQSWCYVEGREENAE